MIQTTHVLLVAADRHARALVAQAIDAVGHTRLTVADSPGEARTLLNAHRYGLVIATNLGIPPRLSIDVIPIDRTFEAMFISGHWDDDLVRECELRRLHRVRVPCDFELLRDAIAKVLSKIRQAAAEPAGQWEGLRAGIGRAPAPGEQGRQPSEKDATGPVRDVGPEVLDFLFDAMRIDAQWSVREPRTFSWWGHRLVQRVWAEPARLSHDHNIVRIHATTALLRNVPNTPELRLRVATTNKFMSLGALTWSSRTNQLLLHSAAYFHAENFTWLKHLFLAAVGLQVADAHIKADGLAQIFGGEPDVSAHPQSGPRRTPDEILNVIAATFAPAGTGPSPWTESDFKATAEMIPRPWVLATSGATGLTAEFPFEGDRPALIAGRAETTLFTASTTERHPQLGSGVLLRLELPLNLSQQDCAETTWTLNSLEASEETHTHALGAWSIGPAAPGRPDTHSATFVSFIPAVVYQKGLLDALALVMAVRAKWAAGFLGGGSAATRKQDRGSSRPQPSGETPTVGKATGIASQSSIVNASKLPLDTVIVSGLGGIALILALLTQLGPIEVIRAGILICISAVLALTNLRTELIPDRITLPFLLVGLLSSPLSQYPGLQSSLVGALIGGGTIFVISLISRGGIGGGVLKMAAMIGAFLGWRLTVLALVLSFIGGGATAWALMHLGRRQSRDSVECAPYLALAATISVLAGDRILSWYLR
jgi:prepilin signal peptidase PulO-like enzyme (type II secretory pathway)